MERAEQRVHLDPPEAIKHLGPRPNAGFLEHLFGLVKLAQDLAATPEKPAPSSVRPTRFGAIFATLKSFAGSGTLSYYSNNFAKI